MNVLQESAKEDLVKKLTELIGSTETIYTHIAEEYPKLLDEFEAGFKNSDSQISLIAAEGGNGLDALHLIMERTKSCIQQAYDSFRNLNTSDAQLLEMLKESIRNLDILDELIAGITFNTEEMELISLNAMVVALKAGHEGGGFSHVTDELRRISAKTITEAKRLTQEGGEIQSFFQEIQRASDSISREQEEIFSRFGTGLFSNFSTIESNLSGIVDFFKQLRSRAGDIREPLLRMMEAVQTQDIIRQTAEQIVVTLDEIREIDLSTSVEDRDDLLLDELTFLEQVSLLGANMLSEIAATIDKNSEVFRENISLVQDAVTRIEQERDQFIARQIEGSGSADGIHSLFQRSEQELSLMLKDARRVPKLKQTLRNTNGAFVARIQELEERLERFSVLVGRFRNIHVAARIEVAKRSILHGMEQTVDEMRGLTERINGDVEQAAETTKSFIETTQGALKGFNASYNEESEMVASFSSEIQRLYAQLRSTNDEIVNTMKSFSLFSYRFRELIDAGQNDTAELFNLSRRARYIQEIFERTATSARSRKSHLLQERGLEEWEIIEHRLQEIVERFTIYAHKAQAGEIGGFTVEGGTEEGEVTFF